VVLERLLALALGLRLERSPIDRVLLGLHGWARLLGFPTSRAAVRRGARVSADFAAE
jgi:hypothetical protein